MGATNCVCEFDPGEASVGSGLGRRADERGESEALILRDAIDKHMEARSRQPSAVDYPLPKPADYAESAEQAPKYRMKKEGRK